MADVLGLVVVQAKVHEILLCVVCVMEVTLGIELMVGITVLGEVKRYFGLGASWIVLGADFVHHCIIHLFLEFLLHLLLGR